MPKGIKGFQKGHPLLNSGKTLFKVGHTLNKGKHWKIKDTSNMHSPKNKGMRWKVKDSSKMGAKKGNTNTLGKNWKIKDTTKMKNRDYSYLKGNTYALNNHHELSEETKKKIKEWQLNHPNKKFTNTSIERKVAKELDKRKIKYKQNINIKNIANVDFYLPEHNVIIECDGDYWHNLPGRQEEDKRKTNLLKQKGFEVYRFWEHEINNDFDRVINKIKKYANF